MQIYVEIMKKKLEINKTQEEKKKIFIERISTTLITLTEA